MAGCSPRAGKETPRSSAEGVEEMLRKEASAKSEDGGETVEMASSWPSSVAAGEEKRLHLEDLTQEIVWAVLAFMPGTQAASLRAALPEVWRDCLAQPAWWRSRCGLEFHHGHALPQEACGLGLDWCTRYHELLKAQNATAGTWCFRCRSHGLSDRVEAPQMFVGPSGQKLFAYGGWKLQSGAQNDLRWVTLDTIYSHAVFSEQGPSCPATDCAGGTAAPEAAPPLPRNAWGEGEGAGAAASGAASSGGASSSAAPSAAAPAGAASSSPVPSSPAPSGAGCREEAAPAAVEEAPAATAAAAPTDEAASATSSSSGGRRSDAPVAGEDGCPAADAAADAAAAAQPAASTVGEVAGAAAGAAVDAAAEAAPVTGACPEAASAKPSAAPKSSAVAPAVGGREARTDAEKAALRQELGCWKFHVAETGGRLPRAAGVQTLTPCWFRGESPSAEFVRATAQELGDPGRGAGASLIISFGGSQQVNYRGECRDWSVGILYEGHGDVASKVFWGKPLPQTRSAGKAETSRPELPTKRGAHSATYVPARLAGGAFPQGCLVVFGGHSDDCSRSLGTVDVLDLATWRWWINHAAHSSSSSGALAGQAAVPDPRLRRHGHSATLVEYQGKGYLIVVGGGRGCILGTNNGIMEDKSDAVVLDTATWSWVGLVNLGRPVDAAAPGRHHTASLGLGNRILLFGGGERPGSRLLMLAGELCIRRALQGESFMELREAMPLSRKLPGERRLHAAASLMPWAPLLVVHGGWDVDIPHIDFWCCALGRTSSDLRRFARPNGRWQLEAAWQPDVSDSEWSDGLFDSLLDGVDDWDDSDQEEVGLPLHLAGRGGQVRVVHIAHGAELRELRTFNPALGVQDARLSAALGGADAPNMGSARSDPSMLNALALAHPGFAIRR